MSLGDYYRSCAIPKPVQRAVVKKRGQKLDAKAERACHEIVRKRDRGWCRIPNCRERAAHQHHLVYRSRAKGMRFDPRNVVSLCLDHHRLVHDQTITISGDADAEIVITGDVDRLRFRL